jgi:hypothetical protein
VTEKTTRSGNAERESGGIESTKRNSQRSRQWSQSSFVEFVKIGNQAIYLWRY